MISVAANAGTLSGRNLSASYGSSGRTLPIVYCLMESDASSITPALRSTSSRAFLCSSSYEMYPVTPRPVTNTASSTRLNFGRSPRTAIVAVPVALLAIYGSLRFSTTLFAELRDVVFVRVTQRAIRRVALGVFRHLHSLSLRFHLERQTGGMTRDIERGTRGISTLLSYLLFSIIPVILEFALVAAVLLNK